MISNQPSDIFPQLSGQNTTKRVDLSAFDGHRIAVVFDRKDQRVVMRGKACFVRDETIGNMLRISLDDEEPGRPVLMISEQDWNGRIIPDFHYGCDYCLIVS